MLDACPHHHDAGDSPGDLPGETNAPPRYWRSIDEWAGTPEFLEMLHREFPEAASEWKDGTSRRSFMKLMAASAALAGLTGCFRRPTEKIVPYVNPPDQVVPGVPLFFATALPIDGFARGALVRSNEGRPTKVEGNPDHPASLGATDVFMQASVLQLYDPDRSKVVINRGNVSSWEAFNLMLTGELAAMPADGAGLRVLGGSFTSPTLARQKQDFLKRFPAARWHQYDPIATDNLHAGAQLAFNKPLDAIYSFDRAKVILSLDADFLLNHPAAIRYGHDFIEGRRVRVNDGKTTMNRLYVIESTPTITGAMADFCTRLRPTQIYSQIEAIARTIADGRATAGDEVPWLAKLLADLNANRGSSLIVAGQWQPPAVHALAHALNHSLGNIGKTVSYIDSVAPPPAPDSTLDALVSDMASGSVRTLLVLDSNPVYDAPVDLKFAEAFAKVPLRIHHGLFEDETAFQCHWHLPATHALEHWSDLRAFDGTASIVQPLIAPLYAGASTHQVIARFLDQHDSSDYELVRQTWKQSHPTGDFDSFWREALNKGVIPGTTFAAQTPTPVPVAAAPATVPTASSTADLEIAFRPDPSIWDGRFSNNGWLQELPKPITKLTWDNAVLMSPRTGQRLKVQTSSRVELSVQGRTVSGPIIIVPGHPDGSVTVHLGYGRTRAGRIGTGSGFNAYALRTTGELWHATGAKLRDLNETYDLAFTQRHQNMEGRDLIRVVELKEYIKDKPEPKRIPLSLYPDWNYDIAGRHKWGMSIDNNACIGCNSCVMACTAENNIAVVGKGQVLYGREMHWLRIDAYFEGDSESPKGPYFEPVPCMHCENAPCELVCPVAATTHSAEGLNEMTYNRCVGTRYCSNNCPYKVRHFNFFQYQDADTESIKLGRNPEVTVRHRGVMEKCTYCVQRIDAGRIESKKHDSWGRFDQAREAIKGIQTACQQACPTNAIVFGDLNLPEMEVVKRKAEPGNYAMLEELNTRPRTTYLPRLVNTDVV